MKELLLVNFNELFKRINSNQLKNHPKMEKDKERQCVCVCVCVCVCGGGGGGGGGVEEAHLSFQF